MVCFQSRLKGLPPTSSMLTSLSSPHPHLGQASFSTVFFFFCGDPSLYTQRFRQRHGVVAREHLMVLWRGAKRGQRINRSALGVMDLMQENSWEELHLFYLFYVTWEAINDHAGQLSICSINNAHCQAATKHPVQLRCYFYDDIDQLICVSDHLKEVD